MIYLDSKTVTPDFLKSIGFMDALDLLNRYGCEQCRSITDEFLSNAFSIERETLKACVSDADYRYIVVSALKDLYETDDDEEALRLAHDDLEYNLFCIFDEKFSDDNEPDDSDVDSEALDEPGVEDYNLIDYPDEEESADDSISLEDEADDTADDEDDGPNFEPMDVDTDSDSNFTYVWESDEPGTPLCYLHADLNNKELGIVINNDYIGVAREDVTDFLATKLSELHGKYSTAALENK